MIIATAGHVDHGKTLLVKSLTGVDTDRLPEEKRRGLTIDLGFAYHHLDEDSVLGFVDVPGHERFIRNMLAGVSAIDFALLVVAADDGIMPQTREHMDILNFLEVGNGAVALTKTDLVDDASVHTVTTEIADLLVNTTLENSPVYPVSVIDGNRGVQALSSHLQQAARNQKHHNAGGNFRFSIDRCFTLSGVGLIVTGTVVAGKIQNGERMVLSPHGKSVKIRSIRAHDRESPMAVAGQRCALNITGKGVEKDVIGRGDWIVSRSLHSPISRLFGHIKLLPSETRALRPDTEVHVHIGAADVTGRASIIGQRSLEPGQTAYVQLTLDHAVGALCRDRLVIRDKSAQRTMAGGVVVDPFPQMRGAKYLPILKAMNTNHPDEAMAGVLPLSPDGIDLKQFQVSWNLTDDELNTLLDTLPVTVFEDSSGRRALWSKYWETAYESTLAALTEFHSSYPTEPGLQENALHNILDTHLSPGVFSAVLHRMIESNVIVRNNDALSLSKHHADMSAEDQDFWNQVRPLLEESGLRPPVLHDLSVSLDLDASIVRKRLRRLMQWALVVQVSENRFFLSDQLTSLADHARQASIDSEDGRFTAGEYRDRTGIGRNLAIEVLEYFDRTRVTGVDGNARRGLYGSR